jgi:transcriptional regulator with XRE-family HTH domain
MSDKFEPWHCRSARAAIGWDAGTLSKKAGVSRAQISAFENGHSKLQKANEESIISAFEHAGIYFDEKGCVCRRATQSRDAVATIPNADLNTERDGKD